MRFSIEYRQCKGTEQRGLACVYRGHSEKNVETESNCGRLPLECSENSYHFPAVELESFEELSAESFEGLVTSKFHQLECHCAQLSSFSSYGIALKYLKDRRYMYRC